MLSEVYADGHLGLKLFMLNVVTLRVGAPFDLTLALLVLFGLILALIWPSLGFT